MQSLRGALLLTMLGITTLGAQAATLADTQDKGAADVTAVKHDQAFNIPPGPLAPALRQFGGAADVLLTFSAEQVSGKRTPGVNGRYTVPAALGTLLHGTGLQGVRLDNGAYTIRPATSGDAAAAVNEFALQPVVVHAAAARSTDVYAGGQVANSSTVGVLGRTDVMNTPFSTTSYTEKKIRDDQARSIADVLFANDPSVRASIGASNRYDAFTIRGLRVANSDVALNGLYGLAPNWRIGTDAVERIELLRGPGGFLYGMAPGGGVGGNVNIITKRADDVPLTRVTTEYSSDAMFGEHVDIGRRFGDHDQYGARLNASLTGGSPPYNGESSRSGDVSLGLDYRGDRLRLSGDFIYQNDRTKAQERGYAVTSGVAVPHPADPTINLSQSYDYSHSQSTTGIVHAEYDLTPKFTLFASAGANTFRFNKRETSGGTILDTVGNILINSNALQLGQYDTVTAEAGVRTTFSTGAIDHQLVLSGTTLNQAYKLGQTTYGNYNSNIYAPVSILTPATSYYPVGKATSLTMNSVALADTLSWHDRVHLTLGLREQHVHSASYSSSTGLVSREYTNSVLTPMVGLVIRPQQAWSLYANYVEGLSPGPTPPTTAVNAGDVFAPFKSKQYEIGSKVDLGKVGFGISVFQISVPNGITDPNSHIYSLNGEQRNRGIELTSFGKLSRDVRILGGMTLFDARQTHTAGGTNDGKFAVGVPHTQLTFGTEWDVPYVHGLTLTSRVIYTGRTFVDAANQSPAPSWTRLDLGARYAFKAFRTPIEIRGTVTNVLNRRYWEVNPSGYIVGGAPVMAWLSVSMDF